MLETCILSENDDLAERHFPELCFKLRGCTLADVLSSEAVIYDHSWHFQAATTLETCKLSENDDLAERHFLNCASNFKSRAKKSGRAGERRDNMGSILSKRRKRLQDAGASSEASLSMAREDRFFSDFVSSRAPQIHHRVARARIFPLLRG